MKTMQISRGQFLIIAFLYVFANDLIRGYYAESLRNDLWIAVALGVLLAAAIFYAYSFLYKNTGYADFPDMMKKTAGKPLSYVLFVLYAGYFLGLVFLNLRDIFEIIDIFIFQESSIIIICFAIIALIIYIVIKDVEVLARLATLLFFLILFVFISALILIFNEKHFEYIFPIMEKGVAPLIAPTLLMAFAIPFGELFVLLIIYQFVKEKNKNYRFGLYGILLGGLVLTLITLYNIIVLGPVAMAFDIHPSLRITKRIDINIFIQRFDLIVVNIMFILTCVKMAVLTYSSQYLVKQVMPVKNKKIVPILLGALVLLAVGFSGKDYAELLLFRQNFFTRYVNLFFEIIIPFLLIGVSLIKKLLAPLKS